MRPRSATALMALAGGWPGVLTLGARWGGKTRSAVNPFPAPTPSMTTAQDMP
jgi:hypothetical protein